MFFIDHEILYSDAAASEEWREIVELSDARDTGIRKRARRKMRRVAKELLRGVRPNVYLGEDLFYDEY